MHFYKELMQCKSVCDVKTGKNGHNAFRTGAKIHFSEKKHFGVMGTLSLTPRGQWVIETSQKFKP